MSCAYSSSALSVALRRGASWFFDKSSLDTRKVKNRISCTLWSSAFEWTREACAHVRGSISSLSLCDRLRCVVLCTEVYKNSWTEAKYASTAKEIQSILPRDHVRLKLWYCKTARTILSRTVSIRPECASYLHKSKAIQECITVGSISNDLNESQSFKGVHGDTWKGKPTGIRMIKKVRKTATHMNKKARQMGIWHDGLQSAAEHTSTGKNRQTDRLSSRWWDRNLLQR